MSLLALSVSVPPALMVQLSGSEAVTLLVDRSKPMAAAMPTLPPLDGALLVRGLVLGGVGVLGGELLADLALGVAAAGVVLGLPFASLLPLSALLPAVLAVAAALLAPEPCALSVKSPPAVTKRADRGQWWCREQS